MEAYELYSQAYANPRNAKAGALGPQPFNRCEAAIPCMIKVFQELFSKRSLSLLKINKQLFFWFKGNRTMKAGLSSKEEVICFLVLLWSSFCVSTAFQLEIKKPAIMLLNV